MLNIIDHILIGAADFPYRTEDIRFSPSGQRLAVAATEGCLLLFQIDLTIRPIQVRFETEIRSVALLVPHGVEFFDEETLIVANRNGALVFFQIPVSSEFPAISNLEPFYQVNSALFGASGQTRYLRDRALFCGPGSVRLFAETLYVTCNYKNTVSSFACYRDQGKIIVEEGEVLAHDGLEVIDGVAISSDGNFMALSDHDHHRVVVYRRNCSPQAAASQVQYVFSCWLRDPDLHYAHGLRFDNSDQVLYVADAGGRFLHVFVDNDGWQNNCDYSYYKTTGVDEAAFSKSQEVTIAAHRALEGGVKGLDIAPQENIIAATCRNQVLRFFETDINYKCPSTFSTSKISQATNFRDDIALSCLVDDTPGIWKSLIPWLATATRLAGITPANIHLHHVCPLPLSLANLCLKLGINTHAITAFSASHPYTNKISQCYSDFGRVESVILSDVDVVFSNPPPYHQLRGLVAGKSVDLPNPPLSVLNKIFHATGLDILGVVSNTCIQRDQYFSFETLIGNFNGGFYSLPKHKLTEFGSRWGAWANWLIEHNILLEKWHLHCDQVAFCLALSELKLAVRVLDNHWNFPTHLKQLPLATPPWVLHHHANLGPEGLLLPMSDPIAQNTVETINRTIKEFRLDHQI